MPQHGLGFYQGKFTFPSLTVTALANADTINNAEAKVVLNNFSYCVLNNKSIWIIHSNNVIENSYILSIWSVSLFCPHSSKQVDSDNDD